MCAKRAVTIKGAPASGAPIEKAKVEEPSGKGFYIGNRSTCPRGFMLKRGLVVLAPYEVREVPAKDADEVRALLKTEGMQAMIDSGLFQVSDKAITSLTAHPTPLPPEDLAPEKRVESTGAIARASASTDGRASGPMRADGIVSL